MNAGKTQLIRPGKRWLLLLLLLPAVAMGRTNLVLELPEDVRAAIEAGVPLSIEGEIASVKNYWLWDARTIVETHRFSISRQALSQRYLLYVDQQPAPHIFQAVGGASNFIAAEALKHLEEASPAYDNVQLRVSLNKFDLPAPMRLQAFWSSGWDLDTGWLPWDSGS